MADEKEVLILELQVDRGQGEKDIDSLTKSIEALKKQNEDLIKVNKELKKSGEDNTQEYLENAKQIELNRDSINKNTSARKNAINAIKAEDHSLGALKARLAEQKKLRDQVNLSTEEGRKKFEQLTAAIKDDTEALLKAEKAAGTYSRQVGNYNIMSKDAIANSGEFGSSLVGIGESFGKMLNPITAVLAAGAGLVKLYVSSAKGARDLAKAQDTLSSAFDIASNAVGDFITELTGGDSGGPGPLETFVNAILFKVNPTLQALSHLAAQAKERMRDLELASRFAQQFAKDDERRAELLRRIRDDESKSYQERLAAAQQIGPILEQSGQRTITVIQAQIAAIKESTINYKDNREAQMRVAELEAEIADKREEITGKLTENVTQVRALTAEYEALYKRLNNAATPEEGEIDLSGAISEMDARSKDIIRSNAEFEKMMAETVANAKSEIRSREDKELEDFAVKNRNRILEEQRIEDFKNEAIAGGVELLTKKKMDARIALNLLFKQDAIQETLANTYDGAVAAYKAMAGIPYIGPVLGVAAAGAVTAYGLARVAMISGIQFAKGGDASKDRNKYFSVGGKRHAQGGTKYWGEDGNFFEVERGEGIFVLKREANADKIGKLSALNQHHGGVSFANRGWYRAQGGAIETRQAVSSLASQRSLAQEVSRNLSISLAAMPSPIVFVEDINAGQGRVVSVQERARVI